MSPIVNVIDIVVSDMEAAVAFYQHLDLDFQLDAQMPTHAGCDTANGLHLMLDTDELRDKTSSGWTRPTGNGGPRTFLSFQYDSPAEVDAKYAEIIAAGYQGQQEPWDAFWGMRYASVVDPDGNGVDLYATLPNS